MRFLSRAPSPEGMAPVATHLPDPKGVAFPQGSPVTSYSRPLDNAELWPLYHFETHARSCAACANPHVVQRARGQLCSKGRALAQDVVAIIYSKHDGKEVFAVGDRLEDATHAELPVGYFHVRSLLRATEKTLGQRQPRPSLSYDRTHHVAPRRTLSTREPARQPATRHVATAELPRRSRDRSPAAVGWSDDLVMLPSRQRRAEQPDTITTASSHPRRRESTVIPQKGYSVQVRRPPGTSRRSTHHD